MDGFGLLQYSYLDKQRDEGVEIGHRASIAHARTRDAQFFGASVDTLTTRACLIEGVGEWPLPIERDALDATAFPSDILDAALAFEELLLRTAGSGGLGKEQGRLKALCARAVEKARSSHGMLSETAAALHSRSRSPSIGLRGKRTAGTRFSLCPKKASTPFTGSLREKTRDGRKRTRNAPTGSPWAWECCSVRFGSWDRPELSSERRSRADGPTSTQTPSA